MFPESTQQIANINDLSRPLEIDTGGGVFIDPGAVGASKWRETLDRTEKEGRGFWFAVARKDGQFITSGIFPETRDSIPIPPFPFGVMGLLRGLEAEVMVRSHRRDRSVIADQDIRAFIESSGKGSVILDRGRVHLLVFTREPFGEIEVDPNLVANAVAEAAKNEGGTMDAMKIAAAGLRKAGIGYFFADPSKIPQEGLEFQSLV